jgi:nitrite reductase/ring-hydroxylating ferredoxin subunit
MKNFRVGEAAWRWANEDMETADCLPFVGSLKPPNPNFYVATGFNGWGITNGTAAGLLVADQILGRENSWAVLYDPTRQPAKALLQNAFSAIPITSVDLIGPGGGGIVEHGGAKIAVWKNDDGIAHAVSATCTHKGCTVTWNNAERTWDCPCHGSIFAADGSIVHGPATQPLPPVAVPTR